MFKKGFKILISLWLLLALPIVGLILNENLFRGFNGVQLFIIWLVGIIVGIIIYIINDSMKSET